MTFGRLVWLVLLNVALLGAIVWVGFAQSNSRRLPDPPPIGGTAGLFMVPGQVSPGIWGCYLLDADSRTLTTYRYDSSARPSRLSMDSSRQIVWDRRLGQLNTQPSPLDIAKLNRLIEESKKMSK
jgi:hypothetical protein